MKIKNVKSEAIVESVITLSTTDKVAIGYVFESLKAEVAKEDAYNEWRNLPYDERNKIDENGNSINPQPDRSRMDNEFIDRLRKLAKFIDKIAIYPSSSNVFDDETAE